MTAPGQIVVTMRARERWIERVDTKATTASAGATIARHAAAIRAAAAFGCRCVKLPSGARLVIDGLNVVTVLGSGNFLRSAAQNYEGTCP